MAEFLPEPSRHLKTSFELLDALAHPEWFTGRSDMSRWRVKSDYIIGVIDDIVASGKYPYNSDVQREVESRLGLEAQPENGSPLSTLVYNAQSYRRSDALIAAGFQPLTEALIAEAHATNRKIASRDGKAEARSLLGVRLKASDLSPGQRVHVNGVLTASDWKGCSVDTDATVIEVGSPPLLSLDRIGGDAGVNIRVPLKLICEL